ncbi:MAG: hypothetical protein JWM36_418 [Hyphomicrobiales bacterium]|nr:hypothetical protein [Hyphomicrobiales bacterium]
MKSCNLVHACLSAAMVLFPAALPALASGTRTVGPWTVVTYDKPDGRKDVAAILSDSDSRLGLAVRCIDQKLSVMLVPLKNDTPFEASTGVRTVLVQADEGPSVEARGNVGAERSLTLSPPGPLLARVLEGAWLKVSVPIGDGRFRPVVFALEAAPAALADLVTECPRAAGE